MKRKIVLLALLISLIGFAQPTTNAPTPTKLATNVVSIFSDAYTNIATNYNPFWGQSGAVNPNFISVSGSGNNVLAYTNFNYQGTELEAGDRSTMEFLHVDIWVATGTSRVIKVSPINAGTGVGEFLVEVPITPGSWNSVDLPKSAFTGMTWNNIVQLKFDGQFNGDGTGNPAARTDIYLDNIYFWKNPVDPAADATLSDLKIAGTTLNGFSSAITTYSIDLPFGTTTPPQITAATTTNSNATRVITQASGVPGSATVKVTSQNGNVNKTYTVNFKTSGPGVAAPTPPSRPAGDVISLFSEAYTNIEVAQWSADWDDSNFEDVMVQGNAVKKVNFANFLGIILSNYINASAMTHFHFDYFVDADTNLVGKIINPKWSNHANQSGETSAFLLTHPVNTSGSWVSVDVPITDFDNPPQTRNSLKEFIIPSNLGTVYFDNIYFHKNTLSTENISISKNQTQIIPNPARALSVVKISPDAKSVEIYDLSGQLVQKEQANNFILGNLKQGIYIVQITNENGEKAVQKLIIK